MIPQLRFPAAGILALLRLALAAQQTINCSASGEGIHVQCTNSHDLPTIWGRSAIAAGLKDASAKEGPSSGCPRPSILGISANTWFYGQGTAKSDSGEGISFDGWYHDALVGDGAATYELCTVTTDNKTLFDQCACVADSLPTA